MTEAIVSPESTIREMSADELAEYGQQLYDMRNESGLTAHQHRQLELCEKNYRELTGEYLSLKYTGTNHIYSSALQQ